MNIVEFGNIMSKEVGDVLGKNVDVDYREVLKNNGITYHALVIKKKGDNVAPTIYIDHLFENYKNGKVLMSIVNEIVRTYNDYEPGDGVDVSFFDNFVDVAPKLSFKVVNYFKNEEILENVPFLRFADLALVPFCMVSDKRLGNGTITIRNEHLKVWEVSKEELWENVYETAPKVLPIEIKNIWDCVPVPPDFCEEGLFPRMFVLSNITQVHGASSFLYPGVMKNLSKKLNSNLLVIPSSVHETIVLPYEESNMDSAFLFAMVKEVNTTVISSADVLSDNVYYYDMKTDKMGILKE